MKKTLTETKYVVLRQKEKYDKVLVILVLILLSTLLSWSPSPVRKFSRSHWQVADLQTKIRRGKNRCLKHWSVFHTPFYCIVLYRRMRTNMLHFNQKPWGKNSYTYHLVKMNRKWTHRGIKWTYWDRLPRKSTETRPRFVKKSAKYGTVEF